MFLSIIMWITFILRSKKHVNEYKLTFWDIAIVVSCLGLIVSTIAGPIIILINIGNIIKITTFPEMYIVDYLYRYIN